MGYVILISTLCVLVISDLLLLAYVVGCRNVYSRLNEYIKLLKEMDDITDKDTNDVVNMIIEDLSNIKPQ